MRHKTLDWLARVARRVGRALWTNDYLEATYRRLGDQYRDMAEDARAQGLWREVDRNLQNAARMDREAELSLMRAPCNRWKTHLLDIAAVLVLALGLHLACSQ